MAGLTKEKAIAFVKQGLGWRTDTDKDDAITVMFDLVQDELEKGMSLPWFLIKGGVPIVTTSGVFAILPDDFIQVVDNGGVFWLASPSAVRRYLVKKPPDWLLEWIGFTGSASGVTSAGESGPRYYTLGYDSSSLTPALKRGHIFVGPTLKAPWTIYVDYYGKDTPFSLLGVGAQNQWLRYASMLLCSHCGLRMAEDIEHPAAVQKFQTRLAAAQARLLADIVMQEYGDREFVMGNQA